MSLDQMSSEPQYQKIAVDSVEEREVDNKQGVMVKHQGGVFFVPNAHKESFEGNRSVQVKMSTGTILGVKVDGAIIFERTIAEANAEAQAALDADPGYQAYQRMKESRQ